MKAISLWQPWATLIMLGAKRVETRGWAPPDALIGKRIGIHASKRIDPCVLEHPFSDVIADPVRDCPQGVLLGTVLLEGAWEIERPIDARLVIHEYHRIDPEGPHDRPEFDLEAIAREHAFGDYSLGRWAWGLAAVRALSEPVPMNGGQRWFEIPPETVGAC